MNHFGGVILTSKKPKAQVYLDDDMNEYLKNYAQERGVSVSRAVTMILEESKNNDAQKRFQIKTHSMLGHILSAVYDGTIAKSNAETVKELINHIDKTVEEKLKY